MKGARIIRLLQDQLGFAHEQNRLLAAQVTTQSEQINELTAQVKTLTQTIASLEATLQKRDTSLEKVIGQKKTIEKLLVCKSEKITPVASKEKKQPSVSPCERGNNKARRKEHFELETVEHDIYPSAADFDASRAQLLKTVDSIRYEYLPPRFIKHVYHLHHYCHQGSVVCGQAPQAPLLGSNYDASFLAGILQLRYLYSMPVERIIKLFGESGFDLNKATAHGLVSKAAGLFDLLEEELHRAILEDTYLHIDETYSTVLTPDQDKGSKKVYIWAALAHHLSLVQFFYKNGSRRGEILTGYLPADYQGAVQSDGLACYKVVETDSYPCTIRLACFQHCKRKFLDIEGSKDADKIVSLINELYQLEHSRPPGASAQWILAYRKKHVPLILDKLEKNLIRIRNKKTTLPKSKLIRAVNYTLNELPALSNYPLSADYELDNNAIERVNRYISLSRKNSLFFGSHKGAERGALIYSLACSCRLNGINSFEYFKDILQRLIRVYPNTDKQTIRELLPDRWKKS